MTVQPPANLYTQGFGSKPENVEVPVVTNVAPTASQVNFPIGKRWINTATNSEYVLTSSTTSGGVTTPTWTLLESGTSSFLSLTGDTGTALPSAGNIKLAGTANQISTSASGSTVTFALTGPYTPATYTAHGVLLGEGTSSIVATAAGATNSVLQGSTGADPAFTTTPTVTSLTTTAAVTAGTSITATLGDITATNGNFVSSAAGKGILLNSPAASGVAASPVVVNGRSGQATFTTVSIAAAADLTLTITNSAITGATTQVIYSMSGATTGSALSIKSITNSAGSSAIVVTNGTGATTSTADIVMNFIVIN